MNSRLFLAICVALFGLFAAQASAVDYCYGMPTTIKDLTCGIYPCPVGTYCDHTGICSATKALSESCKSDTECAPGMCRGPSNGLICVAISGPGETCTGNITVPKADCHTSLTCNMTSLKCYGGSYGDGCSSGIDCVSGICTSGTCSSSVGTPCLGSSVCSPSTWCDSVTELCATRLANGANCTSNGACSSGICSRTSAVGATNQCIGKNSIAAGGYCEVGGACVGSLCSNNHCLEKPPTYCSSRSQCPPGQTCFCGKDYNYEGYGKCASSKCLQLYSDFTTCLSTSCSFNQNFAKSCANLKCKAQSDAFTQCDERRLFESLL